MQQSATGSLSLDTLSQNLSRLDLKAGGGSDVEDIDGLFGDIDWATANFSQLEAQWRSELEAIEKDNVTALLQSSEKGQAVLPAINRAIDEIARVEEFFIDYNRQLKMMGREISQIAEINQALDIQARNQEALLAELTKILASLDVPGEVMQLLQHPAFDHPDQLRSMELAARVMYGVLGGKFERGIKDIRAVAECLATYQSIMDRFETALLTHLVSLLRTPPSLKQQRRPDHLKPSKLSVLDRALLPFAQLIQLLGTAAPQRYLDFRVAYEQVAKSIVTTETAEIMEYLKGTNLIVKTPDEKPSFLLSSNRPSSGFDPARLARGRDFSHHDAFGPAPLPELSVGDKLLPEQLLEYMILMVTEASVGQFDSVEALFFPSETEESLARVGQILDNIFANMQELLINSVSDALIRTDRLSAFPFLQVVERRLPEMAEEIPAMETTLRLMQDRCLASCQEYVKQQVDAIKESRFTAKKRSGVFPFVTIFPKFVQVLERSIEGADPKGKARATANQAYEQLSQAIFSSLNLLAVEAAQTEDEKDNLNANIMTVQNTYYLLEALKTINIAALEPVLKQAKAEFAKNMAGYAALSLARILGRLPDFFESIRKLLQTSSPEEVAFHASYDKNSARRLLAGMQPKEFKRNIEAIRERVIKHFRNGTADGEALLGLVWTALMEFVQGRVGEYTEIILKVYPASDILLPISPEDISRWFNEQARVK